MLRLFQRHPPCADFSMQPEFVPVLARRLRPGLKPQVVGRWRTLAVYPGSQIVVRIVEWVTRVSTSPGTGARSWGAAGARIMAGLRSAINQCTKTMSRGVGRAGREGRVGVIAQTHVRRARQAWPGGAGRRLSGSSAGASRGIAPSGGRFIVGPPSQPFKARDERPVICGDLSVEYERLGRQGVERLHQLRESLGVVDAVTANQVERFTRLERCHAVAVYFFFLDPAGPVEWGGNLGRVHQVESDALGERRRGHSIKLTRASV